MANVVYPAGAHITIRYSDGSALCLETNMAENAQEVEDFVQDIVLDCGEPDETADVPNEGWNPSGPRYL